jgi:hypothetical protein
MTSLFHAERRWGGAAEVRRYTGARYMQISLAIVCLASLLACAGCATHQVSQPSDPMANVPEPVSTPFDGNDKLRSAYIEGYREGYTNAVKGTIVLPYFAPGTLDARGRGFLAGRSAGLTVFGDEELDRQKMWAPRREEAPK